MKVYLVGGAVRDQLLGYPVVEKDWVVVGATPEYLLNRGFTQVGRDFPVFLHPQTKEEYALARTERKSGAGYRGFVCDFNPEVTLAEDLARRDLTINAMAMDEHGMLIDPFHGLEDLHAKRFRHVSPAFVEDPVRVLRVARFAARYHHLGFTLVNETRLLMASMVQRGELAYLVAERVWREFSISLQEKNPEQFILVLRVCGALKQVIPNIDVLFGIPDAKAECAFVDSGLQALYALEKTALNIADPASRFAALFHNIGNSITPMKQWPYHIDSTQQVKQIFTLLGKQTAIPKLYLHLACLCAQYCRQIQDIHQLDGDTIVQLLDACDAFRRPQIFEQLLSIVDAIVKDKKDQVAKKWKVILEKCSNISIQSLIENGAKGAEIKEGLYHLRVECINQWKKQNEK